MHEHRVHSVPDRIISIRQPWVRSGLSRVKAHADTEFGAELHIDMIDGYARIERLSFNAFNEANDFFRAVENYREHYVFYPTRGVLAGKIYRKRETIAWCKDHSIQLIGPTLGHPPRNRN